MCDFVVFYKICIAYEDENKTPQLLEYELENTVKEGYWNINTRDHYFESLCDYYDRVEEDKHRAIERALQQLSNETIYKNNTWFCDVYKKQNYLTLMNQNKISEDSVLAIWKQPDYYMK